MARVSLQRITKNYGPVEVIKGVDLEIEDGTFTVFVGPSGCGKSTLLRMIAGLEDISGGTLTIGDKVVNDLPPKDRNIAMVFQSYAIFPHMTVRENLAFGLTIAKAPKAEKDAKVAEAARILKMEDLLDRQPSQLSGGQRQRVAIGRAIVRKPSVFLFDEPLSNLDAALRVDMRMEIAKLHGELGTTMIYVTHDQVEAMTLADRIVVLNGGVVQQVGSPLELYHRPANLFVAGFIGSPKMNFLSARVEASDAQGVTLGSMDVGTLVLPGARATALAGDMVTLGLRPHNLSLSEHGGMRGKVILVERLGSETLAVVGLPSGQQLVAALPGDVAVNPGETVGLEPDAANACLFLASGEAV